MNKDKKINIAFLGGGIDSAVGMVHKIATEMDGKFRLLAGCFSRDNGINHKTAEEYGIEEYRVYQDLDGLIANEKDNIDAIVILTPTPNHKNDVIHCLKGNIPVICEKALTTSSKDAKEIKESLNIHMGFLAVTYNYTGYPMLRELRQIILGGRMGKINQIHIEMPQEGFIKVDKYGNPQIPQNWRLRDGKLPTISLDLGVHLHNIIYFLTTEKPVELVAMQNSFGHFRQIVDNTICIAKYTNDLICNIWYSKAALGYRNGLRIRVYGETGSAEWYQLDPEVLYLDDNKGHKYAIDRATVDVEISAAPRYNRFKAGHPSGFIEAFANHYRDIADVLSHYLETGGIISNEYVFGVDHALEGLYMLEAVAKSDKAKAWISLNSLDGEVSDE